MDVAGHRRRDGRGRDGEFRSLQLYGDMPPDDNTYIYTDEFGGLTSGVDASRHVLSDSSGHDAINAAAVTSDTTLDLRPGATSQIAGTSLQIAAGTVIEDAYLGDGNDVVTGNDADNYLYGGRGDDTLDGGLGADTIDGAQGVDTVTYATSTAGVTVDLSAGTGSGGTAEGDILRNVENVTGSAFDDTLTGTDGDNALVGGDGNDTLIGGAGNDTLVGGAGDDQLFGGDGDDTLIAGTGNDLIDGGAGNDTALFDGAFAQYTVTTVGDVTTVSGNGVSDQLTGVDLVRFDDGTLYLQGANDDPIAQSQAFTVTQQTPLTFSESDLLAGATDADGDPLSLEFVYRSAHGTVTLTQQNGVQFVVDPDLRRHHVVRLHRIGWARWRGHRERVRHRGADLHLYGVGAGRHLSGSWQRRHGVRRRGQRYARRRFRR